MEIGQAFAGYTIESLLGRGGMGTVYLATHERLRRRVALKMLAPELAAEPKFRERFIRESQLAASLDHACIVPIFHADEHDGVLYIAMRYVEGTDLRTLLAERGRLSPERTLQIVEQVASALDAAHASSLIHRDVKPANILIAEPGHRAFLSDFGLAKTTTASERMTRTGSFLGTVDYCSPEQIDDRPLDARADVYALGCVVYECLVGRPPFARDTDVATVKAHLHDPPPSVTASRPELPRGVDAVVQTALAKDPAARFASAGALVNALRLALSPASETLPPPTVPSFPPPRRAETVPHPVAADLPPVPPPSRPRRWWILAAAVAAIGAAIALAVVLSRGSSAKDTSGAGVNGRISAVLTPIVPLQRRANEAVERYSTGSGVLAALHSSASALQEQTLVAEGKATAIQATGPGQRAARSALIGALVKQAAYAQALVDLRPQLSSDQAAALAQKASSVDGAYTVLSDRTGAPCCPAMPDALPAAQALQRLATRGNGVPAVYTGLFTSVDRLERCNATAVYVYCTAGPSDRAVKLTVGAGATDLGTRPSVDRGGNSMPEGTSFSTPDGKIRCASSSRGISCTDTTTGNGFVIGDYKVIVVSPSSSTSPSVGVPSVYSGRFTAVDRRERCFATDEYVVCNAFPSGKAVRLVLGGSATYEGVLGTEDKGGPSMPEGTSFRTPAGTIACGSSSRGITCTDTRSGNGFTIGDNYVLVTNGGTTQRY